MTTALERDYDAGYAHGFEPGRAVGGTRWWTFPGVHNLRDMGGLAFDRNHRRAGSHTRWGHTFRSDGLFRNPEGAALTAAHLGWALVIDLRTRAEVNADGHFPGAPGTRWEHVELLDEVWRWEDEFEGSTVEFLSARYLDILERRQEHVCAVLELVATEPGPVVFHCAAGKDRTGVIAALLSAVAGVSDAEIAQDYARSASAVLRQLADTGSHDAALSQRSADPQTMNTVLAEVRRRWGSVGDYLHTIGLSGESVAALEGRMAP